MNKMNDSLLIKSYIDFCIGKNYSQTQIAKTVCRTKGWASMLVNGKISKLQFDTRNRIKAILGLQ